MSAVHVGDLVRSRRAAMGITATLAASRAGLTRQGYSKIEAGEVGVTLAVAARLCEVLVIDPVRLMREVARAESS